MNARHRAGRDVVGVCVALALAVGGCAAPRAPDTTAPQGSPDAGSRDAVATLLARAERDRAEGQDERAAAAIERALRVRPEDPALWHRLARVRLDQGRPQDAAGLASRSNSLADRADPVRADNWRLIAETRRMLGDDAGAQEAERRARALADGAVTR